MEDAEMSLYTCPCCVWRVRVRACVYSLDADEHHREETSEDDCSEHLLCGVRASERVCV